MDSVERSEQDSQVGIVKAQVPAISAEGLYDITAHIDFNGVAEDAVLRGGLQIDTPFT